MKTSSIYLSINLNQSTIKLCTYHQDIFQSPFHCQSLWDILRGRALCTRVSSFSHGRWGVSRSSAWFLRRPPHCRWDQPLPTWGWTKGPKDHCLLLLLLLSGKSKLMYCTDFKISPLWHPTQRRNLWCAMQLALSLKRAT